MQHRYVLGLTLLASCGPAPPPAPAHSPAPAPPQPVAVTHGVAVGEVTSRGAVIWARAEAAAEMHVAIDGPGEPQVSAARATAATDFTGRAVVTGLQPAGAYHYRVSFGDGSGGSVEGAFRTAPAPAAAAPVTLAWSGDLGGQNACRDAEHGYEIFAAIAKERPDLFIGLGDMIYADGVCEAAGRFSAKQIEGGFEPAATIESYWQHWRYNYADRHFQRLRAGVPYFAIWDDHETVNDVGPAHDTRREPPYTEGAHLLPLARQAFFHYNPIAGEPSAPLYRNVRWGLNVELWFLDTRQHRDANASADAVDQPKTMLGKAQRAWLDETLAASTATWKVIVSSVPIAIPTGGALPDRGRDGWAGHDQPTGFEHELRSIFAQLRKTKANTVWITTDVHFASVLRHRPFADEPAFVVSEVVTGPLSAGLYPKDDLDDSFGTERLFFHGPEDADAVKRYAEAKRWFNFGTLAVDAAGVLSIAVIDANGKRLYESSLKPR